jgi:uncharacterized protein
MEFNVAQLLKDSVGSTREYELQAGPELVEEIEAIAPYTGKAQFTRINNGVLAAVMVETAIRLSCDRCLTEVVRPLRIEFSEVYRPIIDAVSGVALSAEERIDTFPIDETHTLDLSEAVRQYALVSLPMHTVCRDECKGLCPTCGANTNEVDCGCAEQTTDPRLAVLEQLLDDEEKEGAS